MNGSPGLHAGPLADRLQELSGHPFGDEAIEFAGAAVQVTESLNAHGGPGRDDAEGAPVNPVVTLLNPVADAGLGVELQHNFGPVVRECRKLEEASGVAGIGITAVFVEVRSVVAIEIKIWVGRRVGIEPMSGFP